MGCGMIIRSRYKDKKTAVAGSPQIRWLENVGKDVRELKVRKWTRKAKRTEGIHKEIKESQSQGVSKKSKFYIIMMCR